MSVSRLATALLGRGGRATDNSALFDFMSSISLFTYVRNSSSSSFVRVIELCRRVDGVDTDNFILSVSPFNSINNVRMVAISSSRSVTTEVQPVCRCMMYNSNLVVEK